MLKGVIIFGGGFAVGYSVAMRNQEPNAEIKSATVDFIKSLKAIANDAWLDTKNEVNAVKEKVEGKVEEEVDTPEKRAKVIDDLEDTPIKNPVKKPTNPKDK